MPAPVIEVEKVGVVGEVGDFAQSQGWGLALGAQCCHWLEMVNFVNGINGPRPGLEQWYALFSFEMA